MADLDEDNPLITSSAAQEHDLSEETQDFRFLSSLSSSVILDANQKLPKRGEKDFEANATKLQASTLEGSRQAMHNALDHTRFHNPKHHVVAVLDPENGGAWVSKAKGTMFDTIGTWRKRTLRMRTPDSLDDSNEEVVEERRHGALWLRPEEALHLLERGNLDIRWPLNSSDEAKSSGVSDGDGPGMPMSLQGGYAAFIGMNNDSGLTLEEYAVYTGLKRGGYTVIRPEINKVFDIPPTAVESKMPKSSGLAQILASFWQRIINMEPQHPSNRLGAGPLVTPGLYRNYSDIYRLLAIIPYHDPSAACPAKDQQNIDHTALPDGTSPLSITYHVYRPATPYSKRAPPPPDFYIVVLPARSTSIPTLCQIDDLLSKAPYGPPKKEGHVYQKLKHGYRRVILAIVDEGAISYIRLSDAGFGLDKMYDMQRGRGGKHGRSGRGGRGRGRGRGRGGSSG